MLGTSWVHRLLPAALLLALALTGRPVAAAGANLPLHIFLTEACPHCQEARPFVHELLSRYPELELHEYDVWLDRRHFELMVAVGKTVGSNAVSTPTLVLGEQVWFGFNPTVAAELEAAVQQCLGRSCRDLVQQLTGTRPASTVPVTPATPGKIDLPWFGRLHPDTLSLPALTLMIALLDSFNPCAFFILLFLLSLLVHARSRKIMLLIGGVFVACSGVIYFLFMAAWLNLFLLAGQLRVMTLVAGLVALVLAAINIKDYFFFHRGISLSIPEPAKPKLFERMRGLLKQPKLSSLLGATLILALAANSYELLCTAGFPMIFTRLLTLRQLTSLQYYLYLLLYNFIYILPLLAIVLVFTVTLGSRKLSEWQGRVLKLLSGMMMFGLGLVLLVDPNQFNQLWFSLGLVLTTLGASALIVLLTRTRLR